MRSLFCLFAALAIVATAAADDLPGPSLGEPYVLPSPAPIYGPLQRSSGNSFRIISGPSIEGGGSSAGYSVYGRNESAIEWYHAESSNPSADMPVYAPYCNTGTYGPMMLDVLLFTDISSRF